MINGNTKPIDKTKPVEAQDPNFGPKDTKGGVAINQGGLPGQDRTRIIGKRPREDVKEGSGRREEGEERQSLKGVVTAIESR